MNAEIFFHPDQESKLKPIAEALSRGIHPGIEVTNVQAGHRMGVMWGEGTYKNAGRFVQLLLASLPPGSGLTMGVTWLQYGFYMYSDYFGQHRTFGAEGARVLFPAVAVNERMVMVSEQLIPRLTASERFPGLLTSDAGGLVEVDFDQPESVDKGAQKVGEALRAEAVQMVRRYAAYHPREDPDLAGMAKELGFDVPFLEDALKQQAEMHAFYGQLTCEFSRKDVAMKRWTRVTVKIANSSEVGLHNLTVNIRGPVRIRPDRVETDVPAHGAAQIDIAIQPDEEGEFPVEVVLTLPEDRPLRDWLPTTHVWLTTVSGD